MNIYAYFVVGAAVAPHLVLHARAIGGIRKGTRWLRRFETQLDLLMKKCRR